MKARRSRGQSLVELALVAPILILLAMSVWDGGSVLREQVVLQQAARDGERGKLCGCRGGGPGRRIGSWGVERTRPTAVLAPLGAADCGPGRQALGKLLKNEQSPGRGDRKADILPFLRCHKL